MNDDYDGTFFCTYKQLDDDDLYRIQFLQAFKMTSWNDEILRKKLDKLYNIVGSHFTNILNRLHHEKNCLSHMMLFLGESTTGIDLFQCLMCADVFQEAHLCISNILSTGEISSNSYELLEKCIFI